MQSFQYRCGAQFELQQVLLPEGTGLLPRDWLMRYFCINEQSNLRT